MKRSRYLVSTQVGAKLILPTVPQSRGQRDRIRQNRIQVMADEGYSAAFVCQECAHAVMKGQTQQHHEA